MKNKKSSSGGNILSALIENCKYCLNFKVAIFSPLKSGYCQRKKKIEDQNIGKSELCPDKPFKTEPIVNESCENFQPIMPKNIQEKIQNLFK